MLPLVLLVACGPVRFGFGEGDDDDDDDDDDPSDRIEDVGGFPVDSGETDETGEEPVPDLFATDHVHSIDIYLSDDAVRELNSRRGDDVYQPGTVVIDGTALEEVGFRLKGSYSYRDLNDKAAFKIDFNQFVAGQDYGGLSKVTVNNMLNDTTQLHEMLGYTTFARIGLLSARVSYAWVRVNDEDFGLYALVETEGSGDWMEFWTGNRDGRVYEGGYPYYPESWAHADFTAAAAREFELEAGEDVQNADVVAAGEANESRPDWFTNLDLTLDMQQYVAFTAAEIWTSQWDGYNFNVNNFRVYVSPDDQRGRFLPSGMDWSFTEYYDLGVANSAVGSRCYADDACWAALLAQLDTTCDEIDASGLLELLDEQQAIIDRYVADDPRKEASTASIHGAQFDMRAWIVQRSDQVRAQFGI